MSTSQQTIFDYGPYYSAPPDTSSPNTEVSLAQMESDFNRMESLSNYPATAIRLYTTLDGLSNVFTALNFDASANPQFNNINVIPSIYLNDPNEPNAISDNTNEINSLVSFIYNNKSNLSRIPFVVVGNEPISQVGGWYGGFTDIPPGDQSLLNLIQSLEAEFPLIKFTTAEEYDNQYENTALEGQGFDATNPTKYQTYIGNTVNVIYFNAFPYYDSTFSGTNIMDAAQFVVNEYNRLKSIYPDKPVLLSETGWPSEGPSVNGIAASPQNENAFWSDLMHLSQPGNLALGVFEAFDEPYKQTPNAPAEGGFGIFNSDGSTLKTSITAFGTEQSTGISTLYGTGSDYAVAIDGPLRDYAVSVVDDSGTVVGGPQNAHYILLNSQHISFVDGVLSTGLDDDAAQVYRVYEATLGRGPDPVGLANWVHDLQGGESLLSVIDGFTGSQEFQNTYGPSLSNTQFVTLLYNNVLHRVPDAAGLANWVNDLVSGGSRSQVVEGFSESQEDIAALAAPVEAGLWIQDAGAAEVARLYDTTLGRLPDVSGLINWTQLLDKGTDTLTQVAQGFVGSAEFQSIYGSLNNTQFVEQLYLNTLHRPADATGLANWVADLNAGESRAQIVIGFSESPEHIADMAAYIDEGIWLA